MLFRRLRQSPALAFTVVGTIAIGTAALVASFLVVDASLLRPPPFRDADALVMVYSTHTRGGDRVERLRWPHARAVYLRQHARTLQSLANYTGTDVTLTGTAETESIRGEFVSASYFPTLGVGAALGRVFRDEEDVVAGAHPVVVLSDDFWQRRFGGDAGVVGQAIALNGRQLTVVGVMPRGFRGLTDRAQFWAPATMAPVLTYPDYLTTDQHFISVIGRLTPGATLAEANAELQLIAERNYREQPNTDADSATRSSAVAVGVNAARLHPSVWRGVLLLAMGVALLHLLACVNVTNLLLGRVLARQHEVAVRSALGASRGAVFGLYFGEGVVLAGIGGVLGTAAALLLAGSMAVPSDVWGPANFYGSLGSFSTPAASWSGVLFGGVVTLLSALGVSWAPAAMALRTRVAAGLGQGGARGAAVAGTSLRRLTARGFVLGVESALAVLLLVGGALMVDTFRRLRSAPLGVDVEGVVTFSLAPPEARVTTERAPAYVAGMLAAIRAVPGVTSASVDGGAPVSGTARGSLQIVGRPGLAGEDAPRILRHYVAPDHFRTLGIPLLRGRSFTERDTEASPRVAVISESAARRFWPEGDPIGARVWFPGMRGYSTADSSAEVVGIVRDVVYEPLDVGPNPVSVYTPFTQFTYGWRVYFVRTAGDPLALVGAIREAVRQVDPDVPLKEVQSLQSLVGASWARQRFNAWLFGAFAMLALGLAVSGVYAVVAFAVTQRTREMGIRLALGSTPPRLLLLVLRESMVIPLVGAGVGVVGAIAGSGALRASLYGVSPTDSRVFALVVGVLACATAVAALLPAARAARVAPSESLRAD